MGILGAVEGFWRSRGYRPSAGLDPDLWCLQRDRLSGGGRRGIALIGTSRMQTGTDNRLLEEEFPGSIVAQLALPARSPVGVFEDLAADETFSGLVICEGAPTWLLPRHRERARGFIRHYREQWNTLRKAERLLKAQLDDRLVIARFSPWSDVRDFLRSVQVAALRRRVKMPLPYAVTYRQDRRALLDSRRLPVTKALDEYHSRLVAHPDASLQEIPLTAEEWREAIAHLNQLVQQIRSRGGDVLFIDYPISDEMRKKSAQGSRIAEYWETWRRDSLAFVLRSDDVPELAGFSCPDGLHLDYRDVGRFTKGLASVLRTRKLAR